MFSTMKLVPIIIVATTLAHAVDMPITQDELIRRAPVSSPLARGSVTPTCHAKAAATAEAFPYVKAKNCKGGF
jgi:hypothetical protein